MTLRAIRSGALACAFMAFLSTTLPAQQHKRNLITGNIDESRRVTLRGNVRPEVTPENDLGERDSAAAMSGILLLRRSPENETAFKAYVDQLHDSRSASFHKWLTNAEIGTLFGPSGEDISRVSEWLTGKGFTVRAAAPDGSTMEFDGTAGQMAEAFHTSIHNLDVRGEAHYANVSDPELPAALVPVVSGVASLNNFEPHPMYHKASPAVRASGATTEGIRPTGTNYLSAADLATIYNFNPLFQAGITGKRSDDCSD